MANAPRLELRHSQSLVMTQQLQQSIKLLQMNAQELRGYVDQQLQDNPFLQQEEISTKPEENADTRDEWDPQEKPDLLAGEETFMPEEWQQAAMSGAASRMQVTPRGRDGDLLMELGETKEREVTLKEHLLGQLQLEQVSGLQKTLAMRLIDLVDESGYIREDFGALAEQLGTDTEHLESALEALHRCDPCGVGARNIEECLTLQLKEKDRFDPAMKTLVENLSMLADGDLTGLKKRCGIDAEDLQDMIGEIRALDPKPGLRFNHDIVQHAEPDVTVMRDSKGNWHVELNTSALPKVLVNRRYFAKISVGSEGNDKKYMTERMYEANWLVKALNQRAETILKVSTSIIDAQENFFRMGIHHLKPLTLKDIAKETGYHESTISRVTTGKYLISPRGTFELKYFFTSGLSHKAGGEDVSSQTVKYLIKEMIEKETVEKIFSDDEITSRLKAKNINVARRTVAKYREAEGIQSSTQRRRKMKLAQGNA